MCTHRLDRHPRTVKCKREQGILPPIPFKLRPKYCLCQTERMSQMQMSITVGIRKCHDELVILIFTIIGRRGVAFKYLLAFPQGLDLKFGSTKGIAFSRSFGCCIPLEGEVGHQLRGGVSHGTMKISSFEAVASSDCSTS